MDFMVQMEAIQGALRSTGGSITTTEYKKAKLLAVDPELAVEEEDEDAAANGEAESSTEAARRGPPQQ